MVVGRMPELWGQLSLSCPLKGVTGGKDLRLESNVVFSFFLKHHQAWTSRSQKWGLHAGTDWWDTGIRDRLGIGTLCGPLRIHYPAHGWLSKNIWSAS